MTAPPGSGKTLLAPAALLEDFRSVWVLEPRRVTARLPALTLAEFLGDTVGYRIRLESRWSSQTRLGYLTYGTALRSFIDDPPTSDDVVVFDEFHERPWEAELLIAHLLSLPEPPRVVLMSATLDEKSLPEEVPVIRSDGRLHPVSVTWEKTEPNHLGRRDRLSELVAKRSLEWAQRENRSQLIFLPGLAELRAVEQKLQYDSIPGPIEVLHSSIKESEIRRVVEYTGDGFRRVLSTDLAESSVTLPDIGVVIDSGLVRRPVRDELDLGVTLFTARAPLSALIQRAGRAGRRSPGHCHRLFTQLSEHQRPPFPQPEVDQADYKMVALFLASAKRLSKWRQLPWLYSPSEELLERSIFWCREQGLLKADTLTDSGRQVLSLPVAVPIANFALKARTAGHPTEFIVGWCRAAENPPSDGSSAPLTEWARSVGRDRRLEARLTNALRSVTPTQERSLDEVLLLSYRESLAQLKSDRAVCAHRDQRALAFKPKHPPGDDLGVLISSAPYGREGPRSIVSLFHPVSVELIWEHLFEDLQESESLFYDAEKKRVRQEQSVMIGDLVLERSQQAAPIGPKTAQILLDNLHPEAPGEGFATLTRRLEILFSHRPELLDKLTPVLGDDLKPSDIGARLLLGYLGTVDSWSKSSASELESFVSGLLPYDLVQTLNRELPTRIQLPGRRRPAPVTYPSDGAPYLTSKLQDFFGWTPPVLLDGKLQLVYHLLAPNGRACQITTDLETFWAGSYSQVRKDLRGRYPKHDWPEDPLSR